MRSGILGADRGLGWHRAVAPGVEVGGITTHGLALSRPRRGFESADGASTYNFSETSETSARSRSARPRTATRSAWGHLVYGVPAHRGQRRTMEQPIGREYRPPVDTRPAFEVRETSAGLLD